MVGTPSPRHASKTWLLTVAISVVCLISAIALLRAADTFTIVFGVALGFWGVHGLLAARRDS